MHTCLLGLPASLLKPEGAFLMDGAAPKMIDSPHAQGSIAPSLNTHAHERCLRQRQHPGTHARTRWRRELHSFGHHDDSEIFLLLLMRCMFVGTNTNMHIHAALLPATKDCAAASACLANDSEDPYSLCPLLRRCRDAGRLRGGRFFHSLHRDRGLRVF
jgi:hypothetical protein